MKLSLGRKVDEGDSDFSLILNSHYPTPLLIGIKLINFPM